MKYVMVDDDGEDRICNTKDDVLDRFNYITGIFVKQFNTKKEATEYINQRRR